MFLLGKNTLSVDNGSGRSMFPEHHSCALALSLSLLQSLEQGRSLARCPLVAGPCAGRFWPLCWVWPLFKDGETEVQRGQATPQGTDCLPHTWQA